jgi:hypothetical protein
MGLKGSGVGWFGGSIQPRSPLKFTLEILLYAESTLMSKILATVEEPVQAFKIQAFLKKQKSRRKSTL